MSSTTSKNRYKILRQLGAGDFATVYAARDLKLGRDVAIKQIHAQFLADEQKLARYWQEAQLLVSLEHPNIMTIYDVIKSHGCLVLELMQGSLKQLYGDRPAPLQDVRQTILQAANGLHYLHESGIIHGDIKPGNLLLSRQGLVKLGDFGLARRASDSDGSLLKGTTKYMAPELVSDQFGSVGPASDLYSLGFTALELMCGPEFDSLFPELNAFGRDQQLAWMMWHCSADRKLPEIPTMLEGVPEDLARVLQKLTTKNPAQRYHSAAEVIADLSPGSPGAPVGSAAKDEAAEAEAAERKKKTRRRIGAVAAFAVSVALCLAIALFPSKKQPPPPVLPDQSIQGTVQNVLVDDGKLVLEVDGDWKEVTLFDEDRVFLNRKQRQLRDLRVGDRVVVRKMIDPQQHSFQEVAAFRPDQHRGHVKSVAADEGKFVLLVDEGDDAGSELIVNVPNTIPMLLDGKQEFGGQPVTLSMLKPDDRIVVDHVEDEVGIVARSIDALRVVQSEGIVRDVDRAGGKLTFARSDNPAQLVTLPFDASCEVTLNGLRFVNQQLLKPQDIQPGDKVTLRHDVKIVRLDAYRVFQDAGVITSIGYKTGTVSVRRNGRTDPIVYVVSPDARITLGKEAAELVDLRPGDTVKVTHDSAGTETASLLTLEATRPADPHRWAILVANQNYDDNTLTALDYPLSDARHLRDSLVERYAVPPEQAVLLADQSRVRLEQEIPRILAGVPADAELYVYVATHAYAVPDDNVYLAAKDFALSRMPETGLKLDWLIDQLDACPSPRKLLLLDCSHSGSGADLQKQPSTGEMIELVRETHRGRGYPRTLFVLTSCSAGQRGLAAGDGPHNSLFAAALAEGFAGAADRARNNQLDITELSQFVEERVKSLAGELAATQSPRLILPDDRPPRLTQEAKQAIQGLLAQFSQPKLDPLSVRLEAERVARLAGGQPEPLLAGGLLLLQAGDRDKAIEMLEQVRLAHPDNVLAHEAVTWLYFIKRQYASGLKSLEAMVQAIPVPAADSDYDSSSLALFEWAGRLRELAMNANWTTQKIEPTSAASLDKNVSVGSKSAQQAYARGRASVQQIIAQFDQQIREDPSSEVRVDVERRRLTAYADFSIESAAATIREMVEK